MYMGVEEKGKLKEQVEKIRKGDRKAFEELFFTYFYDLCTYAFQIAKSEQKAKDIVQEVFYKIWKRREKWTIHSSLKAYLYQSVRNEALNQIDRDRHRQNTREELSVYQEIEKRKVGQARKLNNRDEQLVEKIWSIASELPQRRRSVFVLHRKHGLSYREIAQVLGISRKTVENHMGLALSDIREQLEQRSIE